MKGKIKTLEEIIAEQGNEILYRISRQRNLEIELTKVIRELNTIKNKLYWWQKI